MVDSTADVVVVGAGNAALCAALAARDGGAANVVALEASPFEERGGNTTFTGGGMRTAYRGMDDILRLVPDLSDTERANTDFGEYPADAFYDDLARVSEYRADPELLSSVIPDSLETMVWMREKGLRFIPSYHKRNAFKDGEKIKFIPGAVVTVSGGGEGLVEQLSNIAERNRVTIQYDTRAVSLLRDQHGIEGIEVMRGGARHVIRTRAVVLASGGFQANPAMRAAYLGPGWDLARVRGSRFNLGDGIRMAMDIGATPAGNWSGCHAVPWELNAPEHGDIRHGRRFFRLNYPYGIMVNQEGKRFVDEGADFTNYTYAKYGRRILEQPGQVAWQVFDSQVYDFIGPEEYRSGGATRTTADTLDELIDKLGRDGVDPAQLRLTIERYNAAVDRSVDFDPSVRDGKRSDGLFPDKSNWATPIEKPPFEAFAVTCGLTFTFGGLKVAPDSGQVLELGGSPIPGLFAAGELVGGLFYLNYPSGSGLTTGAVIGRRAGTAAAAVSSVGAGQ